MWTICPFWNLKISVSANITINEEANENYITVNFNLPFLIGTRPTGSLQSLHLTLKDNKNHDLIYIASEIFTSVPKMQNIVGPLIVTKLYKKLTFEGDFHLALNTGLYTQFTFSFYDSNMHLIPITKCALNIITKSN